MSVIICCTLSKLIFLLIANFNFDYANQKISECQLWTRGNVLTPGVYYFEFIMEGQVIGAANTKLR